MLSLQMDTFDGSCYSVRFRHAYASVDIVLLLRHRHVGLTKHKDVMELFEKVGET